MALSSRWLTIKAYETVTSRHFLPRLAELNRSQWFSREDVLALQRKKLHRLLKHAYASVPYYRRLFDQVGFKPDDILTNPSAYQKVPTISKAVINQNFQELVTTDPAHQKKMWRNSTGGSTGHPLIFMQDGNFRDYVTADIHRHIGWTGWKFGECHCYIWGADYEVATQQQLRTRLMDWALNRFVTNAFTLNEASMLAFTEEIQRHRPKVLFGYASALERFADFVTEQGLPPMTFLGMLSSAEVLYPHQREKIERTFGCKILNRYGTRELGGVACECPEQMGLHISAEDVYIEILRDELPVPIGQEGDIVVTVLNNYAMPFLRYHIGDIGQLSSATCRCGRGLPLMEVVQGRATDMFKTRHGQSVHGEYFTHLFYGINEVEQFQVIQKDYDHILVSIVPKTPLLPERLAFLERAMKHVMHPEVTIEFQFVDHIPLKSSGKYRFTISEVQ